MSPQPSHKNNIWMPLFVGDYLSDTMHLTTEQHGAYLLLIMAYWKIQKPLPANDNQLASIAKLTPDAWSMHKALLEEFFDTTSKPGKWIHHRVDREIDKARRMSENAQKRGKAGSDARWADKRRIEQASSE